MNVLQNETKQQQKKLMRTYANKTRQKLKWIFFANAFRNMYIHIT